MKCDTHTLAELAKIKYGKELKDVASDGDSGIPVYGTGGLMGYAKRALYDKPSVLIGRKGTIEKVHYIEHPFWTVDTLFYTEINTEIILPKYFFYLLNRVDLRRYDEGTTIPSLRTETLNRLKFEVPPLETQRKIASILSSLDDKIELNDRINANLEEQAKAIFKEMFSDGAATKGILSDIAEVTMGQSPGGSSYNEDKKGTVFFQGRTDFGLRFPKTRMYTTAPKRTAKKNDVLLSVRAPVGDLNIAHEDCCIGRGLSAIRSKDNHQSFVYYTMLSLKPELKVFDGEGTVFGCVNKASLNSLPVSIPSKENMDEFEDVAASIDTKILCNYDENLRLSSLRDALLPRLLSGELEVSELNI